MRSLYIPIIVKNGKSGHTNICIHNNINERKFIYILDNGFMLSVDNICPMIVHIYIDFSEKKKKKRHDSYL